MYIVYNNFETKNTIKIIYLQIKATSLKLIKKYNYLKIYLSAKRII